MTQEKDNRRWLRHGQWPKILVGLHYYSIVSFVLLMVSGFALFEPGIHTVLIPYLPYIYELHIVLGIIFAVSLLTPLFRLLPKGRRVRRLDWWFPIVLGAAIVLTGIFLWKVRWFPTTWRSQAFWWHGRISYVLSAWVVIHAIYKIVGYRPQDSRVNPRVDLQRRKAVRWIGLGLVGGFLVAVIDPLATLRRLFPSQGVSPGSSSPFAEFYTVVGGYPAINVKDFTLTVGGLVSKPVVLSWEELKKLPKIEAVDDFHCVTGWSVPGVKWAGVHIRMLAKLAHSESNVSYVHFYSADGAYSECLSWKEAIDNTVMLAYEMNHAPLRREQGYPLRLVVPKMYGYKSIKWVSRVEFSNVPIQGYWEVRGYPTEAYF